MTEARNKVLLIILDGWGLSPVEKGNATILAKTPVLDSVYANYPKVAIAASGLEVGLNRGEMGNSEVGHLNLGSGRVVWESLPRIDYDIEEGGFEDNRTLDAVMKKASGSRLHLIGLVSYGGVHSHLRHLEALLKLAKEKNIKEVYIHFISDGRDTPPEKAAEIAKEVEGNMKKIGTGKFATLVGRYYAMDRDNRWERVKKAYDLMTGGVGTEYPDIYKAIEANYKNKVNDEFIEPSILDKNGIVKPGDAVIFFNFRADRIRELTSAFFDPNFTGFKREPLFDLYIATMTEYDKRYKLPVVFEPIDIKNTLADELEGSNLTQFHIAETEKYPHVTYFFNGGREEPHKEEEQIVVPSPKVATYDLKPEMSAAGVTEKLVPALNQNDFVLVNFANGDMVGHTGSLNATIAACEAVDQCLAKVLTAASNGGYKVFITADHGNCEIMIDPATGGIDKEHTTSPVPFVYLDMIAKPFNSRSLSPFSKEETIAYSGSPVVGVLSDVAPTVLALLGIRKAAEMVGVNLIEVM